MPFARHVRACEIRRRHTWIVPSESSLPVAFETAIHYPKWTPRAGFGPSQELAGRVFKRGDATYLRSNPNRGEGDRIYAVWRAASDYWAERAWTYPHFSGDLTSPPRRLEIPPSLVGLGKPGDLSFKSTLEFERAQPNARIATLAVATYRITDGAFMHTDILGTNRVTYCYESADPRPDEMPVAIEVRLGEG